MADAQEGADAGRESGTHAFLGLGSNLGDRLVNLQEAVDRLARVPRVRVVRCSRVYETEPLGPPQPDYLNAVVEVVTTATARDLLRACLEVEDRMGRMRTERWGPRVVDIDLLTFGDEEIDEADEVDLTVPHPRMHERLFVLAPLLELTADPPLPGGRNVASVRLGGATLQGVRPVAPPLRVPSSA